MWWRVFQPEEEDAQREQSHDDGEDQLEEAMVEDDTEQRQQDGQECQDASH